MTENLVTWEMDVEGDDPEAVAQDALKTQRFQSSSAVVFKVDDGDKITEVDLFEETVKTLGPSLRLRALDRSRGPAFGFNEDEQWAYEILWRGEPVLGFILDERLGKLDIISWPDGEQADPLTTIFDKDDD